MTAGELAERFTLGLVGLTERVVGAIGRVTIAVWRAISSFSPTRRFVLLLACVAPLWLLSVFAWGSYVGVFAVTLLVLGALVDMLVLPPAPLLEVSREMPLVAGAADVASGTYHVQSHWPRALSLQVFDSLPWSMRREPAGPIAAWIDAAGEANLAFEFVPTERGRFTLGPVALRVRGPLGLVSRTLRYDLEDSVTVAPSLAVVRRYRLHSIQRRLRELGVRTIRRRGEGTAFANLREYTIGDDPRHIDWKASARRNTLITREYTVEQGQTVMLAVDAGRLMTQYAGPLPRFEYAVSSALVLADIALQSGDQVGLLLFDDQVRAFVPPARGATALQSIREALVPARATMAEPDYATAFRTLAERHRKRSLIVMFTDVIDVRASQSLIAHAARGAVRHLPVVVALRNDALVAAAEPARRTVTSDIFESAAAEELLSARDDALRRMRQAGVSVLDVSPTAMTAAVVNKYLDIKLRSQL